MMGTHGTGNVIPRVSVKGFGERDRSGEGDEVD